MRQLIGSCFLALISLLAFGQAGQNPVSSQDQIFTGHAYHVGNGVSPPRPITSSDPDYKALPKKHHEGTVVLSVVVDVDGLPKNVKVTRSLDPELDQKAVDAVKQWRFKPAKKKGQPVPVEINIEVNFKVER